ncbi:MAG: transcriptional repressor [Anaerolineales bacterium]|nr:MAG: transcriptional repressor [Anaerolineales bacterium]
MINEPQARLQEITTKLRNQGHRMTPQRMAVIKTLVSSEGHLNAEQVYDRVKVDFPMTSLATIYKTITMLKEMGELIELSFPNSGSHYDCLNPFPHSHHICTKCGDITDVDVSDLADLPQQFATRTGYKVTSHRLDFFGVCPQCQLNEEQSTVPEGGGKEKVG